MLTQSQFQSAVDFAQGGSRFPDSPMHGDAHWRAVASQGLLICGLNGYGVRGRATAALFGLFHDCRRHNEHHDPEHGQRAALAFQEWADAETDIDSSFRTVLVSSLILHDCGQTTGDRHIGIGWDADRSVLTRCGIEPAYEFFSVVGAGDFAHLIASGRQATTNPPDWETIWASAFDTQSVS